MPIESVTAKYVGRYAWLTDLISVSAGAISQLAATSTSGNTSVVHSLVVCSHQLIDLRCVVHVSDHSEMGECSTRFSYSRCMCIKQVNILRQALVQNEYIVLSV